MPGMPAARKFDMTTHPLPGVLMPGPGSHNVHIGFLPAWRGLPLMAAAALQAAKTISDTVVNAATAAATAAKGTPGAPVAIAAEEATKAAATAAMSSLMNGLAAASMTMAGGIPDMHMCMTPLPIPPHGPGMVIDGSPTVMINGLPACVQGDKVLEALGPPNPIAMGFFTVHIGDGAAAGGGGLLGLIAAALAAAAAAAARGLNLLSDIVAFVQAIANAVIDAAAQFAQNIANAIIDAVMQFVAAFARAIGDALDRLEDWATGRRPVMTDAQRDRAQRRYDNLSPEDQARFDALMANAGSAREREYLRKALAAGRSMDDIEDFGDRIRGKDDQWLDDNLRLTGGSDGQGIQQQFSHSCNATMVQAVRGEYDPIYSLDTNEGYTDITEEQREMLESEYHGPTAGPHSGVAVGRDEAGGSGRWADDLLNDMSDTTGTTYSTVKDPTADAAIDHIDQGLEDGAPVPIVIGNGAGQYTHYVLVTDSTPGDPTTYTIHDPWTGETVTRTEDEIRNGNLNIAGSNQVTAVEVPTVTDP